MKLHEAIEQAVDQWFRPVAWRGSGMAFMLKKGETYVVPNSHGGRKFMTTVTGELAGDWEILDPDDVLKERASR